MTIRNLLESQNARISNLPVDSLQEEKDYLIKFKKEFDSDGALLESSPYTSSKIKISNFINYILSTNRNVNASWIFDSEDPAEQKTRFDISSFADRILSNLENLNDCVELSGGFYTGISEGSSRTQDALDVSQFSIANLDYVNRLAAYVYRTLLSCIETYNSLNIIPSKIGDIIYSTILSPTDGERIDAKVREKYGDGSKILFKLGTLEIKVPDTKWELIAINRLISGSDADGDINKTNQAVSSITIDKDHFFKKHSHTEEKKHSHGGVSASVSLSAPYFNRVDCSRKKSKGTSGGAVKDVSWGGALASSAVKAEASCEEPGKKQNSNDSGTTDAFVLNIEQAYKNVYVWRRIS